MDYAAWHSVVTDDNGKVVPMATVTVRHTDTGALARLYNARDGSEPKGNPFQTGADGMISFFAAGGAYTVIATSGTLERRWSFVPIGTAQEYDIDSLAEYLNSGVIYHQTYADMAASQPLQFPAAAVVLADPDGSKNGYYTNSGSGWVFARTMPDSIARATIYNNADVNSPKANISQGINPSSPIVFFLDVTNPNTGSVNLTIDGIGTGTVLNAAGNVLSAGEWFGRVMLTREQDGRFRIVNDPASAIAAALSATQASEARDEAVTAKDLAEIFADDASESADNAAVSEGNAASSAADALASKNAAAASETAAAGSASTATTKAGEASASATAAAGSANTATTQAGIATTKADEAASSATAASASATTATTEANRAETEADRAEQAAASVESPVSYAPQTLTPAQQAQAKKNIAADIVFDNKAGLEAAEVSVSTHAVRLNGYDMLGDGRGGLYIDTDNGSTDTIVSGDGRTWYRVKDVGSGRLHQSLIDQIDLLDERARYQKRVAWEFPSASPNYSAMLDASGSTWMVPQAFYLDADDGLIYFVYSGDGAGGVWIEVWSTFDNSHITTFKPRNSQWSEGIVVRKEAGYKKLYLGGNNDGTILRYDISSTPSAMSEINSDASYNVDLYSIFDFRDGTWVVQRRMPPVGINRRRGWFSLYNFDLSEQIGSVNIDNSLVGYGFGSPYERDLPKIQTVSISGGALAMGMGGLHLMGQTSDSYSDYGVRLIDMSGNQLANSLVDAELMGNKLRAVGYQVSRIENEGVFYQGGSLYSLCVTNAGSRTSGHISYSTGILVLEEFAKGQGAIDFSDCRPVPRPTPECHEYGLGVFPRSAGNTLRNPVNGSLIESLEDVCDFMASTDTPSVSWFTTNTSIATDISNVADFPPSSFVTVTNCNNDTFILSVSGNGIERFYRIYGTSGSRSAFGRSIRASSLTNLSQSQVSSGYTYSVGQGELLLMGTTMTAEGEITLSPTNAINGDMVSIKRYGGAFNLVVKNGVNGATIATMTDGQTMDFIFSGANWMRWR